MSEGERDMIEVVMDVIDRATEPSAMSKQDALEFLFAIKDQVDGRIEALREEMEGE